MFLRLAYPPGPMLITASHMRRPGMYRDHTALESAECLRGIGSPCRVAEACVACGKDDVTEVCPWEGMAAPSFCNPEPSCNPDPKDFLAEPVPLQFGEKGHTRCQCKSRYYGYSGDPAKTRVANLTNSETLTKLICARCPRGGAFSMRPVMAHASGSVVAAVQSTVLVPMLPSPPHSKLQPRWERIPRVAL